MKCFDGKLCEIYSIKVNLWNFSALKDEKNSFIDTSEEKRIRRDFSHLILAESCFSTLYKSIQKSEIINERLVDRSILIKLLRNPFDTIYVFCDKIYLQLH